MNKKRLYNETDAAKGKRLIAKMARLHKMGMIETTNCHRSGKVQLKEDAKSWVGVTSCQKSGYRKPPSCSICKEVGDNRTHCLMPPMSKRSIVELVSFDKDDMIEF